jgi:hypothetical protein
MSQPAVIAASNEAPVVIIKLKKKQFSPKQCCVESPLLDTTVTACSC